MCMHAHVCVCVCVRMLMYVRVCVCVCVSFNHHVLCDTLQSLCETKSSHPSTAACGVGSTAHKMEAEVCVLSTPWAEEECYWQVFGLFLGLAHPERDRSETQIWDVDNVPLSLSSPSLPRPPSLSSPPLSLPLSFCSTVHEPRIRASFTILLHDPTLCMTSFSPFEFFLLKAKNGVVMLWFVLTFLQQFNWIANRRCYDTM